MLAPSTMPERTAVHSTVYLKLLALLSDSICVQTPGPLVGAAVSPPALEEARLEACECHTNLHSTAQCQVFPAGVRVCPRACPNPYGPSLLLTLRSSSCRASTASASS